MATPQKTRASNHQPGSIRWIPRSGDNTQSFRYHLYNFAKAYRCWFLPYIASRIQLQQFRPILAFLYTDLNCNLDCHYCYNRGKNIQGMDFQVAKDAVAWLKSVGCKVLAYMGGEPLLRRDFIINVTRYAVRRGFFVYLPTNGILMNNFFIDKLGKAGVSTVNLAVDSVEAYQGIPKCITRIRPQLEYLVEREKKYGYITFLNINVTQKNVKDVKALTEVAHRYGIATDYHINEPPLIKYGAYHNKYNGAWITEKEFQSVDDLIDWLIEKNLQGYTMVNSLEHLRAMKLFIRNKLPPWPCRAGQLSVIIRLDGTFAPCFELYGSTEDWGNIYDGPRFDPVKLAKQKQKCSPNCLSTCNFQVSHYSQSVLHVLQWVAKHAYAHLFGIS